MGASPNGMTVEEHLQRVIDIGEGKWSGHNIFMDLSEDRAWAMATCRAYDAAEALIHLAAAAALAQRQEEDSPF